MAAHPHPKITPEEYLELERGAELRHEYYDGLMYAMAGGSPRQAFIIANLVMALGAALKKRPCSVAASDLRVAVSKDGLYTYPDVLVVCGDLKFVDGRKDTVMNPALLIEVLSPSTEAYDRGLKAAQYQKIEALQEYVLVAQDRPLVEVLRRPGQGDWQTSVFRGMEAVARFESVSASVPLAEIYDKITLDDETPPGS